MVDILSNLDPTLGAARAETISIGLSGARVLRVFNARDRPVAVVKLVDNTISHLVDELKAESARLKWLVRLGVPVPDVLGTGMNDGETWLAMRVLPGRPASDEWPIAERDSVIELLAHAVRELHGTAVDSDPFDRSLSSAVVDARKRVESGLVDRSWILAGKEGLPARIVLKRLENTVDAVGNGDRVVSHGDFCLPNVLITEPGVAGFVDVGRAGLADRHSDVADMVRSLRSHMNPQFGPASAEKFLDAYGREGLDPNRLRLHDLLESFFWPVPKAQITDD